jgi:hypothetical protein
VATSSHGECTNPAYSWTVKILHPLLLGSSASLRQHIVLPRTRVMRKRNLACSRQHAVRPLNALQEAPIVSTWLTCACVSGSSALTSERTCHSCPSRAFRLWISHRSANWSTSPQQWFNPQQSSSWNQQHHNSLAAVPAATQQLDGPRSVNDVKAQMLAGSRTTVGG